MYKIKGHHPKTLVYLLICVPELTCCDYIPSFYKSLRMASRDETFIAVLIIVTKSAFLVDVLKAAICMVSKT
jgi:hypothetical protein